jgi:PqqD family protein of HPr-rel-A system
VTVIRLRPDSIFWRESDGEVVALDAATSRYFAANPTAALLWKRLGNGGATEADLVDALCERYEVSRDVAEADVTAFLEQLSSRGLLEA